MNDDEPTMTWVSTEPDEAGRVRVRGAIAFPDHWTREQCDACVQRVIAAAVNSGADVEILGDVP